MSSSDLNKIYIAAPIFLAIVLEVISPYLHTIVCKKVWYSPPLRLNITLFLASMILLGFTMYEAREFGNDQIFSYCIVLTFLTIAVAYYIFINNKLTIGLLILSLVFASFAHNTIFLSPFVDDDNALYLNLFSLYIIWLGFLLSITYQVEEKLLLTGEPLKLKNGSNCNGKKVKRMK